MINRPSDIQLVFAAAVLACSSKPESSGVVVEDRVSGTYQLSRIGGAAVQSRAQALRSCNLQPYYSSYRLSAGQWGSGDSVFVQCGSSPVDTVPMFRADSGTYEMRGDTIEFFVADTTIGVKGLVNRGLVRTDTLIVWGSDLDGGDYVFVQIHTR